ncbi:MAG TPA: hypothetical protein VE398_03045 [Acidobacteriota bacterium]|nr:hypothetical protein [Acidobacteriota bacterium]
MTVASHTPVVVSAVDDLFFSSKIESTAKLAGVTVIQISKARELNELLTDLVPRMIILDLNSRFCDPLEALRRVKADARFAQTSVIGFLSHVQRELELAAREAGCDQVMPRSAFSAKLSTILESVKTPAPAAREGE